LRTISTPVFGSAIPAAMPGLRAARHKAACCFLGTARCNEIDPRSSCAHPGSPEGVFRRQTGRRSGERFLRAGVVIPHPGAPTDAPATTEPDVAIEASLNGSPATGSAPRAVGISKNAAEGAPKGVRPTSLGAGRRVMASSTCRSQGTLRCVATHQRLSALRPLFGGNKKMPKAAAAKVARAAKRWLFNIVKIVCREGDARLGGDLPATRSKRDHPHAVP
jgi:hypothetical protein